MSNQWATRRKFGVLGPSTNTVVEPDFYALTPEGVSNHYARIFTQDAKALNNESFIAGTDIISQNLSHAIDSVMTCGPDYLVMGMSAITFYGGLEGAQRFESSVYQRSGVGCSVGSIACNAALKAYGGIRTIAFLSPYYPIANKEVRGFFNDCGYSVARDVCLECKSWTDISRVTESELRRVLLDLDGDDVDALVQVGTNLSMMRLADEMETRLNKPVVAINAATYWHALRTNALPDQTEGFGQLLAAH
ncbi:MAG: arylmalonate decarboxylase [Pseudomonadota bacterium]